MKPPTPHRRLWGFGWIFAIALAGLSVRLVFVQAVRPFRPDSKEDPQRQVVRSAQRGEILDARGNVLAKSRLLYAIYADPVLIGTNAAVLAQYAAPILGRSEAELVPLFAMRPELRTNRVVQVVAGRAVTNWQVRWFTNRNVLVQSNLEPAVWARFAEQQTNLVIPRYRQITNALAVHKRTAPALRQKLDLVLDGQYEALQRRNERGRALVAEREALRLQQRELRANALVGEPVEVRLYPLGISASHVLGYTTNLDTSPVRGVPRPLLGATGIEGRFDAELQGTAGLLETYRVRNRELVPLRGRNIEARDGLNVRLTIDSTIQHIVEQALDDAVRNLEPKAISCVVVRPRTGEILALANRPTYDPNQVRFAPVENRMNRILTVPTEPGSTFKILTYAAALDLGLAQIDDLVDCEHGLWHPPSGRPVRDVEGHGQGVIRLEDAFAKSSNVAAAKLGLRMTTNQFIGYMRRMGFLQRTGVMYRDASNWGGEHPGRLPQPERINVERHGRLSYGYGLYVTPIQSVMAAAAIANDGILMKPMLVRSLETPEGDVVVQYEPRAASATPVLKPETVAQMKRAMRRVVTAGTAQIVALEDFEVSGKTGTCHKVDPATGRQSSDKYVSTFVGFLPADKPELCILVLADEPAKKGAGSYFGGRACGPVFKAIAQQAASYLALAPMAGTNQPSHLALNTNQPALRAN
jgi:cell division protein FtsI/penicillin-binding protein 2